MVSRKQTSVALSSTEAEYVAAAHASQEAVWLKQLLLDFNFETCNPVILFEDNQGCIKLSESEKSSHRTKHIDIKFHHLRDLVERDIIELKYCPTESMIADVLTKLLARDRFVQLVGLLDLC